MSSAGPREPDKEYYSNLTGTVYSNGTYYQAEIQSKNKRKDFDTTPTCLAATENQDKRALVTLYHGAFRAIHAFDSEPPSSTMPASSAITAYSSNVETPAS